MSPLTPAQRRFAIVYAETCDRRRALEAGGYRVTSRTSAWRLLADPEVLALIEAHRAGRDEEPAARPETPDGVSREWLRREWLELLDVCRAAGDSAGVARCLAALERFTNAQASPPPSSPASALERLRARHAARMAARPPRTDEDEARA